MDPNIKYLIPIFGTLIPIIAVAGVTLSSLFDRWAKLKEKQLELTAKATAEQAAQYAARIATLEERVAVLNRIVTDRNEGLAVQIEALRDFVEKELQNNPELKAAYEALDVRYGLKNVDEFISEAWSNRDFQDLLAEINISEQQLRPRVD